MAIDTTALFKKEAFESLGPERLQLFKKFAADIEGKNAMEIVTLYMTLNKQTSVTTQERADIIEAIRESLPERDKQKFAQLLKMIR